MKTSLQCMEDDMGLSCPLPVGGLRHGAAEDLGLAVTPRRQTPSLPVYRLRVSEIKRRASGRWDDILRGMQVPDGLLARRNMPCPGCNGTDRFQYTDKFGHGNYHCRQCGAGDGFRLLQMVHGMTFHQALCAVERSLGVLPPPRPAGSLSQPDRMLRLALRLWQEARPICPGDDADRYLRGRGLGMARYPDSLRFHPCLGYYADRAANGSTQWRGERPALLGLVRATNGQPVTIHRIYLEHGQKLCKKLLSSGIQGAAIRLGQPEDELNVCEGIETGLAIYRHTRVATWPALNAGNLARMGIPEHVRHVNVFADNDTLTQFSGQLKAFELAARLKQERSQDKGFRVDVHIPSLDGADWADVLSDQDAPAAVPGNAGRALTH